MSRSGTKRMGVLGVAVLLAAGMPAVAQAQEMTGARAPAGAAPYPTGHLWSDPALHPEDWAAAAGPVLGAIDLVPLLTEDEANRALPGVPLRAGLARALDRVLSPANSGSWSQGADGRRVWRLRLETTGAASIGVHFANFRLPAGGTLVIAGTEPSEPAAAYEGWGPLGTGYFNAPPVTGSVAYIEYQAPTGGAGGAPLIEVDSVSHLYREAATGLPAGGSTRLLGCEVDVMCRTVDAAARDAVGRMLFQSGTSFYLCSGSVLRGTDAGSYAAWFLTANHCISSQAEVDSLTVYWLYQTATCNGAAPGINTVPRTIGGHLIAASSSSDFSFSRLADDVNQGQGRAGWSSAVVSNAGVGVTGIHHPGGSFKRYAAGTTTSSSPICSGLPLSSFIYNDWTIGEGVTEGGSSGSPLFNSAWQVVGQLFGVCYTATPGCTNPQDYNNIYGRFSSTYSSVSASLNQTFPDDAFAPNFTLATAAAVTPGAYPLRMVGFADFLALPVGAPTTLRLTADYATADMNLSLALLTPAGTTLQTSATGSGHEAITRSVTPGTYIIRASRTLRWGGPYTLSISSPCAVDVNGDGSANVADYLAFLQLYAAADPRADFNGDGAINIADYLAFLAAYSTGCP
jgi:lysyl endopeptidase